MVWQTVSPSPRWYGAHRTHLKPAFYRMSIASLLLMQPSCVAMFPLGCALNLRHWFLDILLGRLPVTRLAFDVGNMR